MRNEERWSLLESLGYLVSKYCALTNWISIQGKYLLRLPEILGAAIGNVFFSWSMILLLVATGN